MIGHRGAPGYDFTAPFDRPYDWTASGKPELLARTTMYNRMINAPTSVVGHDDLEMYERAQAGLHSRGSQWINVARLYDPAEVNQTNVVTNGTNEMQMRSQMRAWVKFMTATMPTEAAQ